MQKMLSKRSTFSSTLSLTFVERFLLYLRRTNFERHALLFSFISSRYLYTIRELRLNDLGPSLPVPAYRLKDHLKGLELRFRNPNLRPDAAQYKQQLEAERKSKEQQQQQQQ